MKNNEEIEKRIQTNEYILQQFKDEYTKKLRDFEYIKLQYQLKINELTQTISKDKELLVNNF